MIFIGWKFEYLEIDLINKICRCLSVIIESLLCVFIVQTGCLFQKVPFKVKRKIIQVIISEFICTKSKIFQCPCW